jgi:aminoglycoside phosphotransferase (APT) family kinase protein
MVGSVHAERVAVDAGFGSCLYRLYPEYTQPDCGPRTLILKLPSDNSDIQKVLNEDVAFREVRFYRDVARGFECPVPRIYFSDYDAARGASSILMEDLGGLTFGTEASDAESEAVMRAIARFHARLWRQPILEEGWLQPVANTDLDVAWLIDNALESAEHLGFGNSHLARGMRILRPLASFATSIQSPRTHAHTLCHGDLHRNNVQLQPDGRLVIFDWQMPECGNPLRDVGYWLVTSLTVEQRRATQKKLLRLYHRTLLEEGMQDYGAIALMWDLRVGLIDNVIKIFAAVALIKADDAARVRLLSRADAAAQETHFIAIVRVLSVALRLQRWWQQRFR